MKTTNIITILIVTSISIITGCNKSSTASPVNNTNSNTNNNTGTADIRLVAKWLLKKTDTYTIPKSSSVSTTLVTNIYNDPTSCYLELKNSSGPSSYPAMVGLQCSPGVANWYMTSPTQLVIAGINNSYYTVDKVNGDSLVISIKWLGNGSNPDTKYVHHMSKL